MIIDVCIQEKKSSKKFNDEIKKIYPNKCLKCKTENQECFSTTFQFHFFRPLCTSVSQSVCLSVCLSAPSTLHSSNDNKKITNAHCLLLLSSSALLSLLPHLGLLQKAHICQQLQLFLGYGFIHSQVLLRSSKVSSATIG